MGTTRSSATSRPSCELRDSSSDVLPAPHRYTLGQRCRSLYHALWFRISERMRWSRKPYYEVPVGHLTDLAPWQSAYIESLQARYSICFESHYERHTSLANYAYLDLLDQAWSAMNRSLPTGGLVTDVGCANFWYARTLHRFFRPAKLTGVEVEGFRLYPSGYSRYDAAAGYIADLPHSSFVIGNYCEMDEQVDVITAWFPFVTPTPVPAWRLPLTVFSPERLFARIARNFPPEGTFFMANQGSDEAAIAAGDCRRAGLRTQGQWVHPRPIRARPHPPVASWWTT